MGNPSASEPQCGSNRSSRNCRSHAHESARLLGDRRSTALPDYGFSFPGAPGTSPQSPYRFAASHDNLLEHLGNKYQPTKRTHNYLVYYWMHFRDIRLEVRPVLEIGVQADAPFDIIIDDGSHRVEHQLRSFEFLFPLMFDHGIYVVEDTGGCVGDFRLRTVSSLGTLIADIMYWPTGLKPADWPHLSKFAGDATWAAKNIVGIAFYRWIVFVMRGRNPEDNPFLSPLEPDQVEDAGRVGA